MQRYQSHVLSSGVPGIEKQLVLIPFLYIALRVWDSVKYFMIVGGFPTNPCEESTTQTVGFIVIAILEVGLPVILLLVSPIPPKYNPDLGLQVYNTCLPVMSMFIAFHL